MCNTDIKEANMEDRPALICAIDKGEIDLTHRLLRLGVDINSQDASGHTGLMRAVAMGNIEMVKQLLSSGADVNISNDTPRQSALLLATERDDIELTQMLLKAGADVDFQPQWGEAALITTAENGNHDLMQLLLRFDAEVNIQRPFTGESALMIAVANGRTDMIELLLQSGAYVHISDHRDWTAITWAIESDSADAVRQFLKIDVDPRIHERLRVANLLAEMGTENGNIDVPGTNNVRLHDCSATALKLAVARGNLEVVKLVIESGFNINNYLPSDGPTALLLAVDCGHREIVNLLLRYGADMNLQSRHSGDTALILAVKSNYIEIVRLLLKSGADLNRKDKQGNTAVSYVEEAKNVELAQVFLQSGVHVSLVRMIPSWTRNWDFSCPGSGWKEEAEIARLMLKAGADVNEQDSEGTTLLMKSTFENHLEMVKACLDRGADPNQEDNNGRTAFIRAVRNCNRGAKIVNVLIKNGADVNKTDGEGLSPLHYAARFCCLSTVKLLLAAGARVNAIYNDSTTPLSELLPSFWSQDFYACLDLLLDHGTNLSCVDPTLLFCFIYFNDESRVARLLANGIRIKNVDMVVDNSRLKFQFHTALGDEWFAPISDPGSVHEGNRITVSPFRFALWSSHANTARFLAEHTAFTPSDLAVVPGYEHIGKMLSSKMNDKSLAVSNMFPSQPPPLKALSFVTLLSTIGYRPATGDEQPVEKK